MKKHPSKEVQKAIEYAIASGWHIVDAGKSAHCFAKLRCGIPEHREHMMSIWSTPRNPENMAKRIRELVDKCQPR